MSVTSVVICRSNPIAPDPRVEKVAKSLARAGYTVRALGWDRSSLLPTHERAGDYLIDRLPIRGDFGQGMENLPNLLRWQWGLLRWLIRMRDQFALIHACDFDTVLPALFCKWFFRKKVVYDIFDFYADHLRKTPRTVKEVIRWVDLHAISSADALILADDSRWEQIQGARPRQNAVIYNSPEDVMTGVITTTGKTTTGSTHQGLGLHLVYVGLLQVERGLVEILQVLRNHPDWSLDLAGYGGDEAQLHAQAQNIPNIHWHGRIPYEKALQLSQAADVLFATYDPTIPNHRYSSPNKVFEAMMLGKPVVVAEQTNMDRIVRQAGCGLVIPYGDLPALEAALTGLHDDPALRHRLGENGRKAYETQYSWFIMETRLQNLYLQITNNE